LVGRYDKQRLLPFSESLPFADVFPSLRELSPASGRFVPGHRAAPVVVMGHPVAAVVCCEDAMSEQTRRVAGGRAELLVSLSNDGWFGAPEPRLHLAMARLRAIEQRRYLVRATNDGVSAVIDPVGRIVASLPEHEQAVAVVPVRWLSTRTAFDLVGGLLEVLGWAACPLTLIFAGRRRRERPSHQDARITPRPATGPETPEI
jgi:apolipoprotein N-acyltransferase